ncbi:MBL fold metallo-hydrolase [Aeromonas salmonicida]|uniref:MBL fold metallo-hydrolase n=1 Tax=Aeromonas salmonicida TaxID=645 RepID=UPI0039A51087
MDPTVHIKSFLDSDSETFSYIVADLVSGLALIIDPVLDFDYKSGRTSTKSAQEILDYVIHKKLNVEWILETHAHADHLSAAPFFKEKLGAKIGIGEHIEQVQVIFKQIFNLEKEFIPNGAQFDHLFKDGEELKVGNLSVKVIHTPGHTPADLAYLINDSMAFVGDTLFMPDVGTARCDFPGGSASTLYKSISKLLSLPSETEIYICHDYPTQGRGHEYKTTVAAQRKHNIHVGIDVSEDEFVKMREARDRSLQMPRLILPSIQVNIRAGQFPPQEDNGQIYLKVPINML